MSFDEGKMLKDQLSKMKQRSFDDAPVEHAVRQSDLIDMVEA